MRDRVIQRLLEAEKVLERAIKIDQVKLVMDVAAAQYVLATRQKLGEDVRGYAWTIKIRALGRLGELLTPLEKQAGARGLPGPGKGKRGTKVEPRLWAPPTLKQLGIDKKTSSVAQQVAAMPKNTRKAIEQQTTTIAAVQRARKAAEVRKAVRLPDAKYRVLYADPPWKYNDKADAGAVQSGGAERHYPVMTIAELCALSIRLICEENAVLFLWVTSPLLFEAAAVIAAWGFRYKASFVWDKVKHNMGHYNSVRHEFLLVCTRGSCPPDVVKLFDSVQSIERTTHSTKPEQFRTVIDTLYPHGKRLELFARREADGWDTYGNQLLRPTTGSGAAVSGLHRGAALARGNRARELPEPRISAPARRKSHGP
jgi:N6-adenosine-specific RNA methylase IME4